MAIVVPDIQIAETVSVLLSGTGGQGLLLAGRILAEAAAIHDGLNAVTSNSYGPEARGGASRSEVTISAGDIDDLRATRFDILLSLSQKACDSYFNLLKEDGVLIVDSTNVSVVPTSRALELPMTRMAVEECGNRMVANIIGLGAICGCTHVVSLDALMAAVESTMRADLVPMNIKALKLGYSAAEEFINELPDKRQAQIKDYSLTKKKAASKPRAKKK